MIESRILSASEIVKILGNHLVSRGFIATEYKLRMDYDVVRSENQVDVNIKSWSIEFFKK